jgi:hypothetical protein
MNAIQRKKGLIPTTFTFRGKITQSRQEANMLAISYWEKIYTIENPPRLPELANLDVNTPYEDFPDNDHEDIPFTYEEFRTWYCIAESKLSLNKGIGLDGIPDYLLKGDGKRMMKEDISRGAFLTVARNPNAPEYLKRCCKVLSFKDEKTWIKYFQVDMDEISERLKQALYDWWTGREMIPSYLRSGKLVLFNKTQGKVPEPAQTRPITVLSSVRKLIEIFWLAIYSDRLWSTIGMYQMGFRPGGSTHIQIARCLTKMYSNDYKCAIFVDLRKAYDMVDRSILVEAVKSKLIQQEPDLDRLQVAGMNILIQLLLPNELHLSNDLDYKFTSNRGVPQGS